MQKQESNLQMRRRLPINHPPAPNHPRRNGEMNDVLANGIAPIVDIIQRSPIQISIQHCIHAIYFLTKWKFARFDLAYASPLA